MTKEELLAQIHFNSDDEREKAEFYLEMKGIAFHKIVVDFLCQNQNKTIPIEWTDVSNEVRSDKTLREVLYKYLATLEEYIRAYVSNKYEDDTRQDFWINGQMKNNKIKTKLSKGTPLFQTLEGTDFGTLIKQVYSMPEDDIEKLFDNVGTEQNLEAVKELRNAVSHHEFLQCFKFKSCTVDGFSSNSLINNIKNLRQLLPRGYRFGENGKGGITADLKKIKIFID